MAPSALYCGDGVFLEGARYVYCLLRAAGFDVRHIPSPQRFPADALSQKPRLIVLSDYPSKRLTRRQMDGVAARVAEGAGLVMLGGWGTFRGADGRYAGTVIEKILPVAVRRGDDRLQNPPGFRVEKKALHPVVNGLDYARVGTICGLNRVAPKPGASVLLAARRLARWTPPRLAESHPLLVAGAWGRGRTAAFATDLVPHWVGGFLDWGPRRRRLSYNGLSVEVGSHYFAFAARLFRWAASLSFSEKHYL